MSVITYNDDCIEWDAGCFSNGYGAIRVGLKQKKAHRVVFEEVNGPIPDGMVVMHTCDNPPCINPDHLRLGTVADNVADRVAKDRTSKGEQHGQHRLSEAQIRLIRQRNANGETKVQLGKDFGVSDAMIGCIVRRSSWKHVD